MKHISTRTFVLAGIAVALVLAFLVSPYASSNPDGLEKVAVGQGHRRLGHRPRIGRQPPGRLLRRRRREQQPEHRPLRHRRRRRDLCDRDRPRHVAQAVTAGPIAATDHGHLTRGGRPASPDLPVDAGATPRARAGMQARRNAAVRLRRRVHTTGADVGIRRSRRAARRRRPVRAGPARVRRPAARHRAAVHRLRLLPPAHRRCVLGSTCSASISPNPASGRHGTSSSRARSASPPPS